VRQPRRDAMNQPSARTAPEKTIDTTHLDKELDR
jgi:hypothetical protein